MVFCHQQTNISSCKVMTSLTIVAPRIHDLSKTWMETKLRYMPNLTENMSFRYDELVVELFSYGLELFQRKTQLRWLRWLRYDCGCWPINHEQVSMCNIAFVVYKLFLSDLDDVPRHWNRCNQGSKSFTIDQIWRAFFALPSIGSFYWNDILFLTS